MMSVFPYFLFLSPLLSSEVLEVIGKQTSKVYYSKGDIMLRSGELSSNLYFIEKGLVRSFTFRETETTTWLFAEGDWIGSTEKLPSLESLEVLENTMVRIISYSDWQSLQDQFPVLKDITIQWLQQALARVNTRLQLLTIDSPAKRYEVFLKTFPQLSNRLLSNHLASFLHMRPETLSRVKRRLLDQDKRIS
jgi:CRP-like cAMP-binding protein